MADASGAAIASGVSKSFPGGVRALEEVDFAAGFGQIVGLLGANGSGKTTLLRLLFGILAPDAGTVDTLGGNPIRRRAQIRAEAAYVPQHHALDPEMTGRETLALFCALYGLRGGQRRRQVDSLAATLGLAEVAARRVSSYSGGLRQRLHLALGLVHRPRLLLLDEPAGGLDPEGRATVWRELHSAAERGAAVVVITHDLDDAYRHCDRLALLGEGRLRAAGSPPEIVARYGRSEVDLLLAQRPRNEALLRRQLDEIEDVEQVELRERRLCLQLRERPGAEARVLEWLRSQPIDVASYRCERPGLANAYFHLTGRRLAADTRRPQHARRKERS